MHFESCNCIESSNMLKFWKCVVSVIKDVYTFIVCHFCFARRIMANNYGTKYPVLIDLASVILTFWLLITSILVLGICGLYKTLVYIYLVVKHGRQFYGMITGMDMLTILAPGCDGSVHGLERCSTNKSFNARHIYERMCIQIKENIFCKNVDKKLFSTREYTRFGYHYFLKSGTVQVEDIVKYIQAPNKEESDEITESELLALAKAYYNSDLPLENKFNWDIRICLNPIITNGNEGKTSFAILTRMHHTLGDGLVIYNILANNLMKFGPEFKTYAENLVNRCKTERKKTPKHIHKFAYKVLVEKPCILRDGSRHIHSIYGNQVEAPSSFSCMQKIKLIRNKYPGILTTNILMAAYSASLAEYYLKYSKSEDIPEAIDTSLPIQRNIQRYLDIYSASDKIKLSNDVTYAIVTIPVIPRAKRGISIEKYLVQRMLEIKENFDKAINSMDIDCNVIWNQLYFGVLPNQIIRKIIKGNFVVTLTTCMPGGPKLKLFNDDYVDSITFFLPRQYYSTLVLAVNTYDQRLQIALTANEDKVETLSKVNEILDGVFKYLDLLYKQC